MKELDHDLIAKGDELMKHLGALDEMRKKLKNTIEDCNISKEDIANWITTIGKVILSILK